MSGLFYKTADAQIGVNLGLRFGSHRDNAPVERIAVESPVYERNTMAGYYGDNDDRYHYDRDAYRGREQRYDNRREGDDLGRGYSNDERYRENNVQGNREQNSNYGNSRRDGGGQHPANNSKGNSRYNR